MSGTPLKVMPFAPIKDLRHLAVIEAQGEAEKGIQALLRGDAEQAMHHMSLCNTWLESLDQDMEGQQG